MRDITDERVDKLNEKNQQLLRNVDRENKSQTNMSNARRREERENLLQQHKDQLTQVSSTAEGRVRKVMDLTSNNQKRLGRYYADSLDQMADNYAERMDGQREKASLDQAANNKVMTERFRGMEQNFNNRLEQTVKSYEEKISRMNDDHDREIKRLEKLSEQKLTEQGKSLKNEKESLSMKYENKMAQLNESHQDQLDRMNRRHQEDMQNLSTKMSSYSRKA